MSGLHDEETLEKLLTSGSPAAKAAALTNLRQENRRQDN